MVIGWASPACPCCIPMSPSAGIGFMQFYFCIQVHTGPQVCLLGWILVPKLLLFAAWIMCSYSFGDHGDHMITCRGLSAERIADPCLHIHAPWMCAIWHDAQHAIETTGSLLSTSGTYTRTSLHCSVTAVCFVSRLRHFVQQEHSSSFRIGGQSYYPFMSDDPLLSPFWNQTLHKLIMWHVILLSCINKSSVSSDDTNKINIDADKLN
jgi:hypothetical protein